MARRTVVRMRTDLFCVNSRTGKAVRAIPSVWWRTHVANVGAQYDDASSWHWEIRTKGEAVDAD